METEQVFVVVAWEKLMKQYVLTYLAFRIVEQMAALLFCYIAWTSFCSVAWEFVFMDLAQSKELSLDF